LTTRERRAEGAEFLKALKDLLENPMRLLM
jgi:pyruvate/2-oxoglutarate dehydrogenase complex dihydrolipoamide acyltransferase (E2) component